RDEAAVRIWHFADAAFARMCSNLIATPWRVTSKRSFAGIKSSGPNALSRQLESGRYQNLLHCKVLHLD
ncbi:MAG: hypothetical protein AAFQ22_13450, partial [Pseudomonadota bacterium]